MDTPNRLTARLSDEDLMRRVQSDDIRAFAELYDRFSARALGLARLLCASSERAEDAVQDAFLSLWRGRARYDPTRSAIQTWIFALVRNRSIDIYRRNRRADELGTAEAQLDHVALPGSVEDEAVRREEAGRLRISLQTVPVLQREVMVLAYFGGLSHTEIARRLSLPLGTVKGRMRLGLEKVRAEIGTSPASSAV